MKNIPLNKIGAEIHRVRKMQKLSVQTLSDRSGVSKSVIQRLESGESCTIKILEKLFTALGYMWCGEAVEINTKNNK